MRATENEEFINVFDTENANIRNREAFIELLNYTIKQKVMPLVLTF